MPQDSYVRIVMQSQGVIAVCNEVHNQQMYALGLNWSKCLGDQHSKVPVPLHSIISKSSKTSERLPHCFELSLYAHACTIWNDLGLIKGTHVYSLKVKLHKFACGSGGPFWLGWGPFGLGEEAFGLGEGALAWEGPFDLGEPYPGFSPLG